MASCRMLQSVILSTLVLIMKFSLVFPQAPGSSPLPTPAPVLPPAPTPAEGPNIGALQPQPQVTNMIEALRDAGQFGAIAGLLDGLQMKSLTPMTTWLVPDDEAFSGNNYPKNVTRFLDYHVIRELLPFSRLMSLTKGTRIPTFLGTETAVVTNNERYNYSINNAMIVVPDLYSDSTLAVHGISAVLDDAAYNGLSSPPTSPPIPSQDASGAPAGSLSPQQAGQLINITIPDGAHRLPANTIFCVLLSSASVLLANALLLD